MIVRGGYEFVRLKKRGTLQSSPIASVQNDSNFLSRDIKYDSINLLNMHFKIYAGVVY